MKTIAVIGWKNSGKTSLVSNLTSYYSKQGMKVGVVKHAHHNFDIDHKGTDSYKIRKSGSFKTTIVSDKRLALMIEASNQDLDIHKIIEMNSDCEIIIFEGFKKVDELKKIEVSLEKNKNTYLYKETNNVLAIVTDSNEISPIPKFNHSQISEISQFIINNT